MKELFIDSLMAFKLASEFGTPLNIYDENILRQRCREMKSFLPKHNLRVNYSAKANSNLEILKIIKEEGLDVDAMSPGEIYIEKNAGFKANQIFYISNNVSKEEMIYAINEGVTISVDSLSQLELYGKINPGGEICVRFNPGVGAGHHAKVITGGKNTKFGVQHEFIEQVKEILKKYNLKLIGINQHIGSLFMDGKYYTDGIKNFLEIAKEFDTLRFIDIGGGFGVPYKENEERLNLGALSEEASRIIDEFISQYSNKDIIIKIEPGRYIVAECGITLGEVNTIKKNYDTKYVGCDVGFNVIARPVLYDSYHEIKVIKKDNNQIENLETVTIVGNICETGDILAKGRSLPQIEEGDLIAVMNTGAYGYCMSSNYNLRLRPAEVLICSDGRVKLIRKRDTLESLMQNFITR